MPRVVQDGAESHWVEEEEVRDSFTPLQLDVFHALWQLYRPVHSTRPVASETRAEKDQAAQEEALRALPVGPVERKIFSGGRGGVQWHREVFQFRAPYLSYQVCRWRLRGEGIRSTTTEGRPTAAATSPTRR